MRGKRKLLLTPGVSLKEQSKRWEGEILQKISQNFRIYISRLNECKNKIQNTENMKGIEMSRAILEARIKWKKMSSKLW